MDAETVRHLAFTRDLATAKHAIRDIKEQKDGDLLNDPK